MSLFGRCGWAGGVITLSFTLLVACAPQATLAQETTQPTLATTIGTLLTNAKVSEAHWGISVTQMDGTPIYALNDDQLFHPESNVKLFTTAAALALLGPQYTFHTDVVAKGDLSDKAHLHGDLVLRGDGDANFGTNDVPYIEPADRSKSPTPASPAIADIEDLANKVVATGLREVDGDVIGDDSKIEATPYPPGWAQDDLLSGYGAPISALTIHDNETTLRFAPAATPNKPDAATISVTPQPQPYALNASIDTRDWSKDCGDHLHIQHDKSGEALRITGDIPPHTTSCSQEVAIDDPAQYAAETLKQALEQRGVHITGSARAKHWDEGRLGPAAVEATDNTKDVLQLIFRRLQSGEAYSSHCVAETITTSSSEPESQVTLAVHSSPALSDDVLFTNKTSQNLHAELLARNTDAIFNCGSADIDHSLSTTRQYLLFIGLQGRDFVLYDGSGLSTYDLATPRAFTQLLRYAATQPWGADYKSSLPIGGVDGTLETRFTKAPLKGNVFAKTGTSSEDRALSGYVVCASGKTVVFSILATDHLPGSTADRDVMDKIVAAIAAAN